MLSSILSQQMESAPHPLHCQCKSFWKINCFWYELFYSTFRRTWVSWLFHPTSILTCCHPLSSSCLTSKTSNASIWCHMYNDPISRLNVTTCFHGTYYWKCCNQRMDVVNRPGWIMNFKWPTQFQNIYILRLLHPLQPAFLVTPMLQECWALSTKKCPQFFWITSGVTACKIDLRFCITVREYAYLHASLWRLHARNLEKYSFFFYFCPKLLDIARSLVKIRIQNTGNPYSKF